MKNSTCIRTFKTVFSGLEGRRLYDFGWGADYYQEIRGSSPENGAATIFGTVFVCCCFNMGHVSSQPQNMVMLQDFNFNTCCPFFVAYRKKKSVEMHLKKINSET